MRAIRRALPLLALLCCACGGGGSRPAVVVDTRPEPPTVAEERPVVAAGESAEATEALRRWVPRGAVFERDEQAAGKPIVRLELRLFKIDPDDETLPAIQTVGEPRRGPANVPVTDADVQKLVHFPQLRRVVIACGRLSTDGVRQLARLPHLESLDLQDCEPLSDEAISELVGMSKLRELTLEQCRWLNEAHFRKLAGLPLRKLTLSTCLGLGFVDLSPLASMSSLEELVLKEITKEGDIFTGTGPPPKRIFALKRGALSPLAKLPNLRSLTLWGVRGCADLGIGELKTLQQLDWQAPSNKGFPDLELEEKSIRVVAGLPELRTLTLAWTDAPFRDGWPDVDLSALAEAKRLKHLHLRGRVGKPGIQTVASLVGLESLSITRATAQDGWAALSALTNLRQLVLIVKPPSRVSERQDQGKLTDDDLAILEHFPHLESLTLNFTECTADGLERLVRLRNLRSLDLSFNKQLANDAMAHVTKLQSLEHLALRDCPLLTDDGVKHLTGVGSLRSLDLRSCRGLTLGVFAHASRLEGLQELLLGGLRGDTPIEEANDAALRQLLALKRLRRLQVSAKQANLESLKEFGSLPELDILWLSPPLKNDNLELRKALPHMRIVNGGLSPGLTREAVFGIR